MYYRFVSNWCGISFGWHILQKQRFTTLLNVGVSFLSGTIVGIFCNVGITKYYRKKDETIQANNKKLLDEKSDYLKQINSLSDFISAYEDVIANLNAFMCSNPELTNGEDAVGYYDMCKSLWNLPSAMYLDEKILSKEQIDLINRAYYRVITIRNHIEKKEYSCIKISDEALFAIKSIGECMTINSSINEKIRELASKIQ